MATSRELKESRKQAREWVDDDSHPEGGYWFQPLVEPSKHGDFNTYSEWACRCPECTIANRAKVWASSQDRYDQRTWVVDKTREEAGFWFAGHAAPEEHGRYSTYRNWHCRCQACSDANTAAHKAWRESLESD